MEERSQQPRPINIMKVKSVCTFLILIIALPVLVTSVFCKPGDPTLYRITIDSKDLSGVVVEIKVRPETRTVRFAMAAHPEYDDRYYRYVENFTAESGGAKLTVTKPEDAIWQIDGVSGTLTVRYRIAFSPKEREWKQAWKPHLSPNGGMVGDLHTLMYVLGQERRPARLTLEMPAGWKAVSGLEPTDDPHTFMGPVDLLLDSPILVGDVKEWKFTAGGVPHTVAIWSPADEKLVDAAPIVEGIQKLAEQAIRAFGKPTYPRYAFLLENGGQAALEHMTSVNVALSRELSDTFITIAHEYVHVWNLMDVRPRERVGLRYRFAEPTGVLWWSEGSTIMFADLLNRRAGLMPDGRSRVQRLESNITRYLSAPGYYELSAEHVSRGDSHPELLGDNWAGTHLQGEVLVVMLDLMIRDATDGERTIDDVMRLLSERFDTNNGITNPDLEKALGDVCRCDVKPFFSEYIYAAKRVDFDRFLGLIGMRAVIGTTSALDQQGRPAVDLRIGPVSPDGELKLRVTNSNSAWARAGIRTGDKLVSANGTPITGWNEFRNWLRSMKVGDTPRLVVERAGVTRTVDISLAPFDIPSVRIVEREGATAKQMRLRNAWVEGH